jgi:hypothetical protein
MSELVFVEEYRKELEMTGYPFTQAEPVTTNTGYAIPLGMIVDASVYYDTPGRIPRLTALEKAGPIVTFHVGDYRAGCDLRNPAEVLELNTPTGLFGGILVCHPERILVLRSWRDGVHLMQPPPGFCVRCLAYLPVHGVQRFRSDSGELFSGDVVLVSGPGGAMRSQTAPAGFCYVTVDYFGDPTWQIRTGLTDYAVPIQSVVCINADGEQMTLFPDTRQDICFVACNTEQSNLYEDALRIGVTGSKIIFSLGGL